MPSFYHVEAFRFQQLGEQAKRKVMYDMAYMYNESVAEEVENIADSLRDEFGIVDVTVPYCITDQFGYAALSGKIGLFEFIEEVKQIEGTWEFYEILRQFVAAIESEHDELLSFARRTEQPIVVILVPNHNRNATSSFVPYVFDEDEDNGPLLRDALAGTFNEWLNGKIDKTIISLARQYAEEYMSAEHIAELAEINDWWFLEDGTQVSGKNVRHLDIETDELF